MMKKLLFALFFSVLGSFSALAVEAFSLEAFKKAQMANEVILVDVKAKWCSTCAKQAKVLKAYQQNYPNSRLKILEVDYDSQKEWVSHFKAPRQSTFILFKGEEQLWFSVAETRKKVIFAKLQQAETL